MYADFYSPSYWSAKTLRSGNRFSLNCYIVNLEFFFVNNLLTPSSTSVRPVLREFYLGFFLFVVFVRCVFFFVFVCIFMFSCLQLAIPKHWVKFEQWCAILNVLLLLNWVDLCVVCVIVLMIMCEFAVSLINHLYRSPDHNLNFR